MSNKSYDVLVVGGGIIGSCVAYNLVSLSPGLKIAVVDRDFTYEKSSSTLSLCNIRSVGFSLQQNILLALETLKILNNFEEEMTVDGEKPSISFRPEGNLILADSKGLDAAKRSYELTKSAGGDATWLDPTDIEKRWPMLNLDGIAGGTYGADNGHLDVYSLLRAYKKKNEKLGVEYIKGEVTGLTGEKTKVTGGILASGQHINSSVTVNCAGAWAADLLRPIGIEIPVSPVRRQVFVLETKAKYDKPLPFIIYPSGLFFRSESDNLIVAGKAMKDDPIGFNWDWEKDRFMDTIWPSLADAVHDFKELRLVRGWAGLYEENTLDANGIIGPWPESEGLYLCNGFSGRGIIQGLSSGTHVAELITGKTPTLDLSIFSPKRIFENRRLGESGHF